MGIGKLVGGVAKTLIKHAPDILPLIITAITDAETLFKGKGFGKEKKEAVMKILTSALGIKDYFTNSGSDNQEEILELVSGTVDLLVGAFNFVGLFDGDGEDKIDFTPKPFTSNTPPEGAE